jgi:hypothetical protein
MLKLKSHKRIPVQNIFTKNEQETVQLQNELNTIQSEIDQLYEQMGEDLGWITYGDLDPVVEQVDIRFYRSGKNKIEKK